MDKKSSKDSAKEGANADIERAKQFVKDFDAKYSTPEACNDLLAKLIRGLRFRTCDFCDSEDVEIRENGRALWCLRCKQTTRFTAKTFFHGIVDTRRYLLAILIYEEDIFICESQFAKIAKVCQSAAWDIFAKLGIVTERSRIEEGTPVHSANFEEIFIKRSLETPARTHPVAEQKEVDDAYERACAQHKETKKDCDPANDKNTNCAHEQENEQENEKEREKENVNGESADESEASDSHADSSAGLERELLNMLSKDPMNFEVICSKTEAPVGTLLGVLMLLELAGLVKRLPGEYFVRTDLADKASTSSSYELQKSISLSRLCELQLKSRDASIKIEEKEVRGFIDKFIAFVKARCHGVSRKYFQLYLAMFSWLLHRQFWKNRSLLELCARSGRISNADILAFVSPRLVQVAI